MDKFFNIIDIIFNMKNEYLFYGLFMINAWAFMLFGWDKICAESGRWRVAESTLLSIAFFGGTLGAYMGRMLFRHKTRKQPFSDNLFTILIIHCAIAMFIFIYKMLAWI